MAELEEVVRRVVREEVREALEGLRREPAAALSIDEAAVYLGLRDERAVRGLISRREVAFVKVGRQTVITREALDQYLKDHTIAVEENPWGLTDHALRHVREDRATGRGRRF